MSVVLLVSLAIPITVHCSVYNNLYSQAAPISVETPKVRMQHGIVGESTIYMNDTSAKVSVSAPTGLEYGCAFKSSNVRVSTTSGTPVDDPEAVLSVNVDRTSQVLIIYNAGNKRNSVEHFDGKGCAINIDGMDVAFSWQSPYDRNRANSVTVAYATELNAGTHLIKGRFFANSPGNTVGIDTRQIVVFWFSNVVARYVRSTVVATTTSGVPVDDPQAILDFTLSNDSVAFILYNVGNKRGSREPARGKGITLNVDGANIATRQWQSPYNSNGANSVTIVYVTRLAAGFHTIKGCFFSNAPGSITTIDERQLIVFCFPLDLVTYGFVQSTTPISTTSGASVDDIQAVLNLTLTKNSDALIMYVGGNLHGATENYDGKGFQLQVNGVDQLNSSSWQSPYGNNYADSSTSIWCEQLTAGSHTIKGRFFANNPGYTVTISHRQLAVLAFLKQQPAIYNYVLKITNQVADSWRIRLRTYDQSNIKRLHNCTIHFYYDDAVSRQIYIYNGECHQPFGNWSTLKSLSTIYIAITVLATSEGTTYIYTYLEVLKPNTSTYNLMIITFEVT
ncbi:MAG: hypothetical protein QXY07_01700 [Candidatus Bathyarchaeia archaeon]